MKKVFGKFKKNCTICNNTFYVRNFRKDVAKYCSRKCLYKNTSINQKGDQNPNWKGGTRTNGNGYIEQYSPEHPRSHQGYVLQHRFIMEKIVGRFLNNSEVVHHINGIRNDNRIENLVILTRAQHNTEHSIKIWARKYTHCKNCKKTTKKHMGRGYCSSCYWKH